MNFSSFLIAICLFESTFGLSNDLDDKYGPVTFVSIIYRHGDRTPIKTYPKDPYRNESDWPIDWAQLTNIGKLHHYHLGKWFRQRYVQLFPDSYSHKTIRIQSTDVDRTLMSALANTAGMYPPGPKDRWSQLNWNPIPIHSTPENLDKILAMKAPCPKYERLLHKFKTSPAYKKLESKYTQYYPYLKENTGQDIDLTKMEYLYSTLSIEEEFNFTLPNWTKTVYPKVLREAGGLDFSIPSYTTDLKRLKGGPLLKRILGIMSQKVSVENPLAQNISVYSAHDTTVSFVLNTLGVFNFLPPPFASSVLIELREKDNEKLVTILYKNETRNGPYLLTVPGCQEACPLDKLIEITKPVIPEDWDSECQEHTAFDFSLDQPYNTLAIFAMVTSTLIVFLLLASTSLYWHKQKPSHTYRKLNVETL